MSCGEPLKESAGVIHVHHHRFTNPRPLSWFDWQFADRAMVPDGCLTIEQTLFRACHQFNGFSTCASSTAVPDNFIQLKYSGSPMTAIIHWQPSDHRGIKTFQIACGTDQIMFTAGRQRTIRIV
jgi:hypothetical protein